MIQQFLISLSLAILESLLTKGSKAFGHYLELKSELENNKKRAAKYDQVVKSGASREERKNAEDDILS